MKSDRLIIKPKSEEHWLAMRAEDVTSTQVSSLFEMGKYGTHFQLWHNKHDGIEVDFSDNERVAWGNYLQDAIATGFAKIHGVLIRPMKEYIRIIDARMGASFDFEIMGVDPNYEGANAIVRNMVEANGPGILEIKNVDRGVFYKDWKVDKETKHVEAPGHIELQLQAQCHIAERSWGCICVLVGGNQNRVVVRQYDKVVGDALEQRVRNFWNSVKTDVEPPAKYPDDAEFICKKLYDYAEPAKVFDARGNADVNDLLAAYNDAGDREKLAKEDKKVAQAKLYQIIDDAERVVFDGGSIWCGMVGPAPVTYTREGYRGFKVNRSKAK